MTVTQHACITLACDVCGVKLDDEIEGYIPHFTTLQQARDYQSEWDDGAKWIILDDGYALCPDDDESHGSVRESLKPVVPVEQIRGQQEIPAETDPLHFDPAEFSHIVVDGPNAEETWTVAQWNEYIDRCKDPRTGGEIIFKVVRLIPITRTCTGCDGTGQRRDFDADGDFESVEPCGGCDGTGRVATVAESGAAR